MDSPHFAQNRDDQLPSQQQYYQQNQLSQFNSGDTPAFVASQSNRFMQPDDDRQFTAGFAESRNDGFDDRQHANQTDDVDQFQEM